MRARHLALAPVAPLLLVLAACNASVETGTETEPSLIAQAPPYEVVQEEETGTGTDITVTVGEAPAELAVQSLVGELQEDRTEDGVYALEVLCASTDEQLATAEWAQGEEALAEASLEEGEIDIEADEDATCEA